MENDLFSSRDIELLTQSVHSQLQPDEGVLDLFCGAGGWGAGLLMAGVRNDFAVNHDAIAIEIHKANHPWCHHAQGDAWRTKPRSVAGKRKIGLMLASAACTTHSKARGGAPISKRVHMLGGCIMRYVKDLKPRVLMVENVPEWLDWGPTKFVLDARGNRTIDEKTGLAARVPNHALKGQYFKRWVKYLKAIGYEVEWRVLDAADYGAPSRRKRLFVMARRDKAPIIWPEKTHGPGTGQPWRSAASIIDWSDLGHSIFLTSQQAKQLRLRIKRPLKPKTQRRIVMGILKFVIPSGKRFALRVTNGDGRGWKVSGLDAPLPTQTTRQDLGVVSPVLATTGYGERSGQAPRVHSVQEPLTTAVNGIKQAVASPVLQIFRGNQVGRSVSDPLPTITAGNGPGRGAGAGHAIGITLPILANNTTGHTGGRVEDPAPTITTGGQAGVVAPVCVQMRQGQVQWSDVQQPLNTVCAGGLHHGVAAPVMTEFYGSGSGLVGRKVNDTLGAVTTIDRHGVSVPVLQGPMSAEILDRARQVGKLLKRILGDAIELRDGMVVVNHEGVDLVMVDILFRMLKPAELAAAMGFPADYIWPKAKRDAVKLIGNAVSPTMARALLGMVLPRGGGSGSRRQVA